MATKFVKLQMYCIISHERIFVDFGECSKQSLEAIVGSVCKTPFLDMAFRHGVFFNPPVYTLQIL